MAKRIKINHNKGEDYRGNYTQFAFRFDNSSYTFEFAFVMTYKAFLFRVRSLAEKYGATQVDVIPLSEDLDTITVQAFDGTVKFYKQVIVKEYSDHYETEKQYFNESEIFNR